MTTKYKFVVYFSCKYLRNISGHILPNRAFYQSRRLVSGWAYESKTVQLHVAQLLKTLWGGKASSQGKECRILFLFCAIPDEPITKISTSFQDTDDSVDVFAKPRAVSTPVGEPTKHAQDSDSDSNVDMLLHSPSQSYKSWDSNVKMRLVEIFPETFSECWLLCWHLSTNCAEPRSLCNTAQCDLTARGRARGNYVRRCSWQLRRCSRTVMCMLVLRRAREDECSRIVVMWFSTSVCLRINWDILRERENDNCELCLVGDTAGPLCCGFFLLWASCDVSVLIVSVQNAQLQRSRYSFLSQCRHFNVILLLSYSQFHHGKGDGKWCLIISYYDYFRFSIIFWNLIALVKNVVDILLTFFSCKKIRWIQLINLPCACSTELWPSRIFLGSHVTMFISWSLYFARLFCMSVPSLISVSETVFFCQLYCMPGFMHKNVNANSCKNFWMISD